MALHEPLHDQPEGTTPHSRYSRKTLGVVAALGVVALACVGVGIGLGSAGSSSPTAEHLAAAAVGVESAVGLIATPVNPESDSKVQALDMAIDAASALRGSLAAPHSGFDIRVAGVMATYAYAAYSDSPSTALTDLGATALTVDGLPICQDDVSAFIGFDSTENAIVVSFRGTRGFDQLTEEVAHSSLVSFPADESTAKANEFFVNAAGALKVELWTRIALLRSTHPDASLWVTGHSLGAAMAAITAFDLVHSGTATDDEVLVYTFGQPRVGDRAFSKLFADEISHAFRVVAGADPVPHLPLQSAGYSHAGTEAWFPAAEDRGSVPSTPRPQTGGAPGEYAGVPCGYQLCTDTDHSQSCSDGIFDSFFAGVFHEKLADHSAYWATVPRGFCGGTSAAAGPVVELTEKNDPTGDSWYTVSGGMRTELRGQYDRMGSSRTCNEKSVWKMDGGVTSNCLSILCAPPRGNACPSDHPVATDITADGCCALWTGPCQTCCTRGPDYYLYQPDGASHWVVSGEDDMNSCANSAFLISTGNCVNSPSGCETQWQAYTGKDTSYKECKDTWCSEPGLSVQ